LVFATKSYATSANYATLIRQNAPVTNKMG
jgi:hypothetical protein